MEVSSCACHKVAHSAVQQGHSLFLSRAVVTFTPTAHLCAHGCVALKIRCGQTHCYFETGESDCAIEKQTLFKGRIQIVRCSHLDVLTTSTLFVAHWCRD